MSVTDRRKRVQRLKVIIITVVMVLLILPSVFCVILALKVGSLEKQIKEVQEELNTWIVAQQEKVSVISTEVLPQDEEEETENEVETKKLRKVYLTFDDGPSQYTGDILEILDFYEVKATFFVTGMNVPRYDEYYAKIVEEGHTLGIHSYSHIYSEIYSSLDSFKTDWKKMQDYIYEHTGETVTVCRFPGGSSNTVSDTNIYEMIDWLEGEGAVYYDWNVSAGDAEARTLSPEQIAANCIEGVKQHETSIVLLHDVAGKKSTIEALPLIIEGIKQLEDTILLPIDAETVPIQHISSTKE